MPVFAKNRLGLGAGGYGLLLACVGIGGLVGALLLAARSGVQAGSRTLRLSTIGYPIMLLALSALTTPWLAYIALFFAGVAMIANGAIANSMLQHNVPDALRGRLMAAYSFVVVGLAQTFGSFVAGAVARVLGVQWAIALGAAAMLGYAMYVFRRPPFRIAKTAGPSLT